VSFLFQEITAHCVIKAVFQILEYEGTYNIEAIFMQNSRLLTSSQTMVRKAAFSFWA
jgi:hypothetical protein